MQEQDFENQKKPLVYKTKTIKRLERNIFVFHCTTRTDAEARVNRNMVVVKHDEDLSLIDPIRLTDDGEKKLIKLGRIRRIVRLGGNLFSAQEDRFYCRKFRCDRWAPGEFEEHKALGVPLHGKLTHDPADAPFDGCKVFCFRDTLQPEAVIVLTTSDSTDNILVTGDCLQSQLHNEYINAPVIARMKVEGLMESDIVVCKRWLKKMSPRKEAPPLQEIEGRNGKRWRRMSSLSGLQKQIRNDFMRILGMDFDRLLSTSGNNLKYDAKKGTVLATEYAFPLWERGALGM